MKEFGRVFQYVWPQWPRVVVVFISAMIISILLSASFMTIIPLLSVMVNNEGLPSWVDRKACDAYYGLDLAAPEASTAPGEPNRTSPAYLRVVRVRKHSLAKESGLKEQDCIVDVNGIVAAQGAGSITYVALLRALASPQQQTVPIRIVRATEAPRSIDLITPLNEAAVSSLGRNSFARLKARIQLAAVAAGRRAVSLLPPSEAARAGIPSVIALMLAVTIITAIRCVAKFYQDYLGQKVVQIAINNLREDLFAAAQRHQPDGQRYPGHAGQSPPRTDERFVHDGGGPVAQLAVDSDLPHRRPAGGPHVGPIRP